MRHAEFYTGKPVLSLQEMLRSISEVNSNILPVIPDGRYDQNTFASVRSFQETYGLPPTGEADLETWDAVIKVYDQISPSVTTPATRPSWDTDQSVQPGQFNYHLYLVQAMLAALSDFFPQIPRPELTGNLDTPTQDSLIWLQSAAGLRRSGALTTETWNYLNGLSRTIIGNGQK